MTRRLLVVCTANVCRSPVAALLAGRLLAGRVDVDGERWTVTSAGTDGGIVATCDEPTRAAAAAVGVDVGGHLPRRLDRAMLATDGADLVVTMSRRHVRTIVALDERAWSRTFTLKELVRRAGTLAPRPPGGTYGAWLAEVARGRRPGDLMGASPDDDVADPYGGPVAGYAAAVAEIGALVTTLVRVGPWSSMP